MTTSHEMLPKIDAVMILGKELRNDPERARRELAARAAAASVALRRGAHWIAAVEARLKGQEQSGSSMVADLLAELGIPADQVVTEDHSRSTREEAIKAVHILNDRVAGTLCVITAAYHVPRVQRYFSQVLPQLRFHVTSPETFLPWANDTERAWIEAGTPTREVMAREGRTERLLSTLGEVASRVPYGWRLEMAAAAWLRRADER